MNKYLLFTILKFKGTRIFIISIALLLVFSNISAQNAGSLDPSFGDTGLVTTSIGTANAWGYTMTLQSDRKIIVGGSSMQNGYAAITLARYQTNGSLDSSFGNNGIVITKTGQASCINSLALQSNNKIVASGYTFINDSTYNFTALRYNISGNLDGTFGNGGVVLIDVENSPYAYNVAINASGKIIISGYSEKNANTGISLVQLK